MSLAEVSQGYNIALIAAMDKHHVIGKDNEMPWHLPDDLKFFKTNTTGKTVIMGRKTFESIGAKPLPNRRNLIISRNPAYAASGAEVFSSVEAALVTCDATSEIIIMGGGQLYLQMLAYANKLYVTMVDAQVEGDTVFPKWEESDWKTVFKEFHPLDDRHRFAFEFMILERI